MCIKYNHQLTSRWLVRPGCPTSLSDIWPKPFWVRYYGKERCWQKRPCLDLFLTLLCVAICYSNLRKSEIGWFCHSNQMQGQCWRSLIPTLNFSQIEFIEQRRAIHIMDHKLWNFSERESRYTRCTKIQSPIDSFFQNLKIVLILKSKVTPTLGFASNSPPTENFSFQQLSNSGQVSWLNRKAIFWFKSESCRHLELILNLTRTRLIRPLLVRYST